jgi:hypothetical protein
MNLRTVGNERFAHREEGMQDVRAGDEAEQAAALYAGIGEKRTVHAGIRKGNYRPPAGTAPQRADEKALEARRRCCSMKLMDGSGTYRPRPAAESGDDTTGNENCSYR